MLVKLYDTSVKTLQCFLTLLEMKAKILSKAYKALWLWALSCLWHLIICHLIMFKTQLRSFSSLKTPEMLESLHWLLLLLGMLFFQILAWLAPSTLSNNMWMFLTLAIWPYLNIEFPVYPAFFFHVPCFPFPNFEQH